MTSETLSVCYLMESGSDAVKVAGVKTSDGDASVHSHVDGVLITELVNHISGQSSEGKHADLVGQVIPVVGAAEGEDL